MAHPDKVGKGANTSDSTDFALIISQLQTDMATIKTQFDISNQSVLKQLNETKTLLLSPTSSDATFRQAIVRRMDLEERLRLLNANQEFAFLKSRYYKGIEIIKIIYEKLLSLDHHYSGMQTYQNIMLLSNPHTYPEFQKSKSLMEQRMKKGFAIKMPSFLETNPFLSATFSLVSSFLGEGDTKDKEKELESISCILDFTVRMNGDLNVIYHETEYLKTANKTLKENCEKLFEDYTKAIGYVTPIDKCRKNDDWETLYDAIEAHFKKIEPPATTTSPNTYPGTQPAAATNTSADYTQSIKSKIGLEFATTRVADMITKYRNYVTQGIQYYQKFDSIMSSYGNEQTCQAKLPRQFSELKFDIKSTIEKFQNTYTIAEIEGSKLKDLMYGFVEK
jgi:hypothetical protein